MPNLSQFNATNVGDGVSITATYDDKSTCQFTTDQESAAFIVSIVQALATTSERMIAAENRAAAANRTADRLKKRTSDEDSIPTKCDAQFMRLVRAVCPRYDEASPDDDPRLVAMDVLKHAPVDAFSAVCGTPLAELQLNQSIQILEQVGDYMKANDVKPKAYDARETIKAIGDSAKKLWGRK